MSRHDAALQAQLQPLHSLTKWRLCCNRALNVWQVVINKGILMQCATTVENKLLKYTATVHHKESTISYNILYAFEKPNTIVSLCLDNKKKANKPRFNVQRSFQCFDNVMHFIQNPKQSPYTPWQYKCSHNGKKQHTECEMSPQWCKKK